MIHQQKDALPDLNSAKVQEATIKIQSAYRGFKTREELKDEGHHLPDLKAKDVAAAAIKIQAVYKGFKARQMIKDNKGFPSPSCQDIQEETGKVPYEIMIW